MSENNFENLVEKVNLIDRKLKGIELSNSYKIDIWMTVKWDAIYKKILQEKYEVVSKYLYPTQNKNWRT